MIKTIKSWRWDRLFSKNAWENCDKFELSLSMFATILTIVIFYCIKETQLFGELNVWEDTLFWGTFGICTFALITLWFNELWDLCCSDDFFKVYYNKKLANCYIYKNKKNKRYLLKIIQNNNVIVEKYIDDYKTTKSKDGTVSLLYSCYPMKNWLLIHENGFTDLGKKIQENVFLMPQYATPITKARICILYKDSFWSTYVDYFVSGSELYIPQGVKPKIHPTTNHLIKDEKPIQNKTPNDYLLIKNDGKYCFIGLYLKEMLFQELILDSCIFNEGLDTIILSYNDHQNDYFILHKKQAESIHFDENTIIEKSNDYEIGGKVLMFNESTNVLVNIYEGPFFCFDSSLCHIIGNDNNYHP